MAEPFSPDAFYDSAREFARTALEAHHAENYRRVALDGGTALEHLAKACLARRSPALLVPDLKNESAVATLAWLLKVDGAKPQLRVRTISLWDALLRIRLFVAPTVALDDLKTLADMRDGVIHGAQEAEMEAQVLTAFVQQAETLLADLGRERANFWAGRLGVVDALLADASDKVAHAVAVKLEAAEASYSERFGTLDPKVLRVVRAAFEVSADGLASDQAVMRCPVCESNGVAVGDFDVEIGDVVDWDKETGDVTRVEAAVWFTATSFYCRVCGLKLDSPAELAAANVTTRWEIEDADPRDYEPPWDYDEDAAYDAWREERAEREGRW